MVNHDFSLPVYIAKKVATSGHFADLSPLEIGIFDKKTSSVATAAGNGKEFFLAGGSHHTRDKLSKWFSGMTQPKKSSPFYGKDIISFEKAYPSRPQNEEWVLGYDGSSSSRTLAYEKNKQYKLKIRLFGDPALDIWGKPLTRTIVLNTPCFAADDCSYDCPDGRLGVKAQTIEWVRLINSDVELAESKIKAYPVFSDYNSTATTAAFTGGTGTAATVSVQTSGGVITGVTVLTPGAYSVAPTGLTITNAGGGSGATFTIQTTGSSPSITVTGVTVTAGGSGYTYATANTYKYSLTVLDNGGASSLQDVQRAYPTYDIERLSYANGYSTYEVVGLASIPADYTPTSSVLAAICGECPTGYTHVVGYDTYIIRRQVASNTDLDDSTSQATFAATIVTAYSGQGAVTGTGVYQGLSEGAANVRVRFTAGSTVVVASGSSDVVEQIASTPDVCTPNASITPIDWVQSGAGYTTTRQLTITIPDDECDANYTTTQVAASLANEPTYVSGSVTDITGSDSCTKTFRITQKSNYMEDVLCMSPDVAEFETLPAFHSYVWEPIVADPDEYDADIKAGIRITAPFYSKTFNENSFTLEEFWDAQPLRMEISLWDVDFAPCRFAEIAEARRTKFAKFRNLIGESVLRTYVRQGVYFPYEDWSNDPRIREVIDNTALSQVKREAYYVAYYLTFKESRTSENFDKQPMIFEPVIFVEEGDLTLQGQLEDALQAITAKFGVGLENRTPLI